VAVQTNGALLADRYRVVRRLGSGGAATVLLCEDQRLGRLVAIKRLHTGSPDEMAERLQREAKLGASLNHPNLVSVFDTVTYDEGLLIVMEYVEGETLAQAQRNGPLPLRRALQVIRGVAAALDHAHSHGIVHRDVKPANVLLGNAGTVKLADLGIGLATDHTRITRAGVVLGTPAYMAPEQLEGVRVTPAADVFSLGALSYELLSGRKPREGSNAIEVARRAASEPPPELRDAWPDAPKAASDGIGRAMSLDPTARQRSAGELADELERALLPGAPRAERRLDSPLPPPAERSAFPRWLPVLALGIVAVVAVLALTRGGGGGGHDSTARKAPAVRQKPKPKAQTPAPSPAQAQTQPPPPAPAQGADRGRQLNDEGKALIDAGEPAQAIPILQQAVAAFPPDARSTDVNYAYALFNLADAYVLTGQYDKAVPLLQQRLQIPNQRGVVRKELERALKGK
jgi:eukaryotic-like serine/threonine-protein kinase